MKKEKDDEGGKSNEKMTTPELVTERDRELAGKKVRVQHARL